MITSGLTRPLTSRLTRAIAEAGVGGGWAAALPALRSFVATNYDQPNPHNQAVMASPPTVTANGTSLPAGMAVSASITPATVDTAALRLRGGTMVLVGGNYRVWSADIGTTGGNAGTNDGKNCAAWRADIVANAAVVTFRVAPTVSKYRFIVDGQYVDLTGSNTVATTGSASEYIKLDFTAVGGKAIRTITMEGQQTCGPVSVWCQTGETLTRPSDTPIRIAFAGDSFTIGTGAVALGDGFAWVCADKLGARHSLSSGSGGTGYVATASGTAFKLADRLSDISSTAPHDVIVVAMGLNDLSQSPATVTTEVATCLSSLRASHPTAQLFVVGPWDVQAPAAPAAGHAAIKAAIVAGIPAGIGATFLDPEGVAFVNTDGTHPNTAGHKILGDWLALQIKTAMGA